MSRNQVSIYILSFLTIFIITTFSSLGLSRRAKLPKSLEEKRVARLLYEHILQDNLDGFTEILNNYPQYINIAYYHPSYDDYLTPLQSAALLGRDDFIDELLLKRKIDLFSRTTNKGNSILHLSSIPHITKRLIDLTFKLEARNAQLMTPLLAQAYKTILNREVIHTLLEAGANPNARTTSELTALHILFKPHHANSHRENLLTILEDLLDHGATVDATTRKGATALHFAAGNNDVEAIRILVNKANQIGIKDFFINTQNSSGDTPFSIAYKHQSKEAITQLLKLGANPFLRNNDGVSVNGDARLRSSEGEVFDFSKFVSDEIRRYIKPSVICAQPLTT